MFDDNNGKRDFDIWEETARGMLYRGGKEADYLWTGYVWGMLLMLGVTVLLIIIGLLAG